MLNRLKEFFGFTKKEMNGLLVFCLLLLIILLVPLILSRFRDEEIHPTAKLKQEIEAFRKSEKNLADNKDYYYPHRYPDRYGIREVNAGFRTRSAPVYFRFNPNELSMQQWMKLGLSTAQARVILNYEAKGGSFKKKEDLKRIYSLSEGDYRRLEPYIVIPETQGAPNYARYKNSPRFPSRSAAVSVELNSADSSMLETVKGIGPVLASRLVRYRDRLGGFLKKEQIREVYGIDSVRYAQLEAQLTVNPAAITRIPINSVDFEGLKRFPYLSYKQMNAIIQYRKQHGRYSGLDDLKKIAILNEEILRKIAPYLIFE